MTKTLYAVALSFTALLIFPSIGLTEQEIRSETSLAQKYVGGTHVLRKMSENADRKSEIVGKASGGGFFLFGGGSASLDGKSEIARTVTFAWYCAAFKAYLINTIPVERVHVQIVDNATAPRVEFHLVGCGQYPHGNRYQWSCPADRYFSENGEEKIQQAIQDYKIDYVTFSIREDEWPTDLDLPMNR